MESFGQELKRIRRDRKITLRELSEYIGKSIGYLSDIEQDRKAPPDLDTVEKIELFLNIKDNYLLKLAAEQRKQRPVSVTQRIKMRPILTEVLLRADELLDDDQLKNLLADIEEKGRK
jgi:transcriptional regulator with XRE-family HTH domain